MRLWVWRNFRIELPEDWEMLQFSRRPRAGRCAFADRYQHRLEMSWRAVAGQPDIERMMSDYCSKLRIDKQMEDAAPMSVGPWLGIHGHAGAVLTTRFGRFFAGESCLVELVFPWAAGRDKRLEQAVLDSVGEEPERLGRYRRWRSFGMDLLASKDLGLDGCDVQPALARLTFGDPHSPRRRWESFERMGMTSEWLRTPLAEWLLARMPKALEVRSRGSGDVAGHRVETVGGTRPVKGVGRLLGRKDRLDAAAWLCPADGRLYCATVGGSPSHRAGADAGPGPALPGGRLSCCGEMARAVRDPSAAAQAGDRQVA